MILWLHGPDPAPAGEDKPFLQALASGGLRVAADGDGSDVYFTDTPSALTWCVRERVYDEDAKEGFIQEFLAHISDGQAVPSLIAPLRQLTTGTGDQDRAQPSLLRLSGRESLFQLLLQVDKVQTGVALGMLERLPEHVTDEDEQGDNPVAESILKQFSWITHVVEPNELASKMLECLMVLPVKLQHTIIRLLRDIVADADHTQTVRALKDLLEEDHGFIPVVLETLGSLNLSPIHHNDVLHAVYPLLSSAPVNHLPTLLHFLLNAANSDNAKEIVQRIRTNLDLVPTIGGTHQSQLSTQQRERDGRSATDAHVFLLETLRCSLQFHRVVATAFLREIGELQEAHKHSTIDLWIVWVLWSCETHHKAASKLLKAKISQGLFASDATGVALHTHSKALHTLFDSLLRLASELLRSKEREHVEYAIEMTVELFANFRDRNPQLKLMESIVAHLGSGSMAQMDGALAILVRLCDDHPTLLRNHLPLLKHTLDFLDSFSNPQLRNIFYVLFSLALDSGGLPHQTLASDHLRILIRKQLSLSDLAHKRIGIVGSLACMRTLASSSDLAGDNPPSSTDETAMAQAQEVWTEAVQSCQGSSEALSFLHDELVYMVLQARGHLGKVLLEYLSDTLAETFDEYLEDFEDGKPIETPESAVSLLGVDHHLAVPNLDGSEAQVSLHVTPVLAKSTAPSHAQERLQAVPAIFKAIHVVTKQLHGDMNECDAPLGMPVLMFDLDKMGDAGFESLPNRGKELACMSLMCGINWLREVVNAYATDELSLADQQLKVVQRVEQLHQLESKLIRLMILFPGFSLLRTSPPCVYHSSAPRWQGRGRPSGKKDAGGANMSVKIKKATEAPGSNLSHLSEIARWLRPLELDGFSVLTTSSSVFQDKLVNGQSETEQKTEIKVQMKTIMFLLTELERKVKSLLAPPAAFRLGRSPVESGILAMDSIHTPEQVITALLPLVRALAQHTQTEIVEAVINEDDEQSDTAASILVMWFRIVSYILRAPILKLDAHNEILNQLLVCLAQGEGTYTGADSSETDKDLPQLVEAAVSSFQNFAESVSTAACAAGLVTVFDHLLTFAPPDELSETREEVGDAAKHFLLQSNWSERSKGAEAKSADIYVLARAVIRYAEEPIGTMHDLYTETLLVAAGGKKRSQDDDDEDEASQESGAECSLPKKNLPALYKTLAEELAVRFSDLDLKHVHSQEDLENVCRQILARVQMLGYLANYAKHDLTQQVVGAMLRNAVPIVDYCGTKFIPFLDANFDSVFEHAKKIIRDCNKHSRKLKVLCDHAKKNRDAGALRAVPSLQRGLERLIFSVKDLLNSHNASEMMTIKQGNHKIFEANEEGVVSSQLVPAEEIDRFGTKWGVPKKPKKRKRADNLKPKGSNKGGKKRKPLKVLDDEDDENMEKETDGGQEDDDNATQDDEEEAAGHEEYISGDVSGADEAQDNDDGESVGICFEDDGGEDEDENTGAEVIGPLD